MRLKPYRRVWLQWLQWLRLVILVETGGRLNLCSWKCPFCMALFWSHFNLNLALKSLLSCGCLRNISSKPLSAFSANS